ncbi:parathyroid hormone 4 [Corythoichthys intestinalis]|uniref:parathyroid hormone 4 n=1 Tax=Corythoichthys intestinalis TaxID=161448 RepID=UPI0025A603A9|nr:parathyroid hormone 4 [Corythoichthys intestinalis]
MKMCHLHVQWLLVLMLLVFFPAGLCQQEQSRRAVSEHQLMHDRGRNIQSLKRLIWLSGAMEGLHTAQTRSVADPYVSAEPAAEEPRSSLVQNLLRDFFKGSYGAQMIKREP